MILWHNPRCSKSRAALKLLEERGVGVTVRRYLEDPPGPEELEAVRRMLGVPAAQMMRRKEAKAGELPPDAADDELIAAMTRNPILIERPIAIAGSRAVIGRPPEAVLDLL